MLLSAFFAAREPEPGDAEAQQGQRAWFRNLLRLIIVAGPECQVSFVISIPFWCLSKNEC
jgi:hypothetical protein